ncbi:single-stranded DNA-binding protein [Mucilaginibacter terrenus]|nr:single-stranded DNA-binding protein [Mucilaginibacter terrenus]
MVNTAVQENGAPKRTMLSNTGVNKAILLGEVYKEPYKQRKSGEEQLYFTLVTHENVKRGDGNIPHHEYHTIHIPEALKNIRLQQGQTVYVEGKLHTISFVDDQQVKRYNVEISVSRIEAI